MAKVVVLSAKPVEFDGEDGQKVKLIKLELLEKIGDEHIVGTYFISEKNRKGFEEDMLSPDIFDTEWVLNADFAKEIDRKTNTPKLVLTALYRE